MHYIKKAISFLLLTALILSSALPAYAATHYKYDALGRLIEVTHSSGKIITYTYDAMGNMTAVVTSSETIIDGFNVSGKVRSYNPNNPVTLQLMQDNEVKHRAAIAAEAGSGQRDQDFTFENVEPGTYMLVITKDAHTKFTVQTIVVSDGDLDLTLDSRPEVQLITLLCGDINKDGFINVNDLNEIWSARNYNKAKADADNPLCDLNGDGFINVNDLNIIWSSANYNKRDVLVP